MLLLGLFWLLLLAWTPYQSARLYEQSYQIQKKMIALDNVAVRIGKLDRSLLRQMEELLQKINTIERLHHPLHYCAHLGIASAACVSQDQAVELTIKSIQKGIELLKQKWRSHHQLATHEAKRLNEKVCAINRPAWPFQSVVCYRCGLKTRYVTQQEVATQVEACDKFTPGAKVILSRKKRWNYELREP